LSCFGRGWEGERSSGQASPKGVLNVTSRGASHVTGFTVHCRENSYLRLIDFVPLNSGNRTGGAGLGESLSGDGEAEEFGVVLEEVLCITQL